MWQNVRTLPFKKKAVKRADTGIVAARAALLSTIIYHIIRHH
jgi:hypothetical protein